MTLGRARRASTWLLSALLIAATPPAPADAGTVERIRRDGVLRWGADIQGGEPYAFRDPTDSTRLIGFEVEIAAALARHLGVRAEMVQNDWQHLVASLQRGDFDIILNGLEVTAARQEQLILSRPYFAFDEVLVTRREAPVAQGLGELVGHPVGTLNGSLAHDLLRAATGVEVVLYEGVEEPFIDLEQRRLDAVLIDHIIAERYGLVRPGLQRAAVVGSGFYAIGMRRSDEELATAIQDALAVMIADGELRAILSRWSLWSDRQVDLPATLPRVAPADTTTPHATFSMAQFWLFARGAGITVIISTLAMALAIGGGLGLSLLRAYGPPLARAFATIYVELFRGTPVLLQLYVLYYGLAPLLTLDALTAAVLGLGLNYAAYESEIYRAGLQAVPLGQTEAALALGLSRRVTLRHIVLPQALRVALPGMANDFIALLKDSSLVSVITVVELTKQMTITAVDVRGWLVPGLVCAAFYLALSMPLSHLARRLERRLSPAR